MTAARYRAKGGAPASGSAAASYTTPGARSTGTVRTALPVIYQLRMESRGQPRPWPWPA
jgi:hypothetical protein